MTTMKEIITVKIEADVHRKLKILAARLGLTLSDTIKHLLTKNN